MSDTTTRCIKMHSRDYHDYVIKDGKLIGEFDSMYRHSDGIPWHQDQTAYSIFSDIDLAILNHFRYRLGFRSLLEVGCGLGYFTNRLQESFGNDVVVSGLDVSDSAVKKASNMFPDIDFMVADLVKENVKSLRNKYDVVMEKEVLWYVLDDIDLFFSNMRNLSNRYFYISQSFPESKKFLGCDVFHNANELVEYISNRFTLIHSAVERDPGFGGRELVHILAEINQ